MDTIMDRESRHRKLMAMSNQHRELDKAKPRAIEYPHVYGAPTGGNILNAFGQKYVLPLGTERHLEDVYPLLESSYISIMRKSLFLRHVRVLIIKKLLLCQSKISTIYVVALLKDIKVLIEFNPSYIQ